jgi:Cu-Zn family superoxide dismutase
MLTESPFLSVSRSGRLLAKADHVSSWIAEPSGSASLIVLTYTSLHFRRQIMHSRILLVGTVASVAFCVALPQAEAKPGKTIELKDAKGQSIGKATLNPKGNGIKINYDFKNLPPGEHAIHIHQNAKCEADPAAPQDAFKSAGPHFNPENKQHGLENPQGSHAGDMANFIVGASGMAVGSIDNPRVTLNPEGSGGGGTGGRNSVFTNGGTALVVHAKPDDMKTDPAGNAGPRIACGTITK